MSHKSPTLTGSELVALLSAPGVPVLTNRLTSLADVTRDLPHGICGILCHGKCDNAEVAVRTIRLYVVPHNTTHQMLKIAADEFKVWSQMRHDHVVPLLGLACIQGQVALVSPWVHNGRILDFLRESPSTNRLKMCTELASAVAYLHTRGVVHRNIQAKNVLVSKNGNLKLVGFGTTTLKELGHHDEDTKEHLLRLRWTAPEIVNNFTKYTTATDVWALGMTILEIFTRLHPYATIKDDQDVLSKVTCHVIPTRTFEFNGRDQLWSLLVRCWSYDPKTRPTAAAVYDALRRMT